MADSMYDLENDVRESVREHFHANADGDGSLGQYPEDDIHEIVDGWVPIYTGELMELAAKDIGLATNAPELGPAFDGEPTPVNIIAANIYERLYNVAMDELRDIQESLEEVE